MKANPEKFQLMILSKTSRSEYNVIFDSNVIKESADVEKLKLIVDNIWILSFEKHIEKLYQTPSCTQTKKKILNIRKSQSIGKCFCGFSIQLCTSNLDILQKNYLYQNTENSP